MLTATLLALSLVAGAPPGDTPLEPISLSTVEAARLLDGEMTPGLCERFAETADQLAVLRAADPGSADLLSEMMIDYWVDDFEDTLGRNQSLTPEAEEAFEAWVGSCVE